MTQDEIIRMAREAGGIIYEVDWCFEVENLERFAALVVAHEREQVMNEPLTKAMWDRFESEIRADEREACAKVCDAEHDKSKFGVNGMHCAAVIRARSNHG